MESNIKQLHGVKIGFGITSSLCTLDAAAEPLAALCDMGADVYPIISKSIVTEASRFHQPDEFSAQIKAITGRDAICTIADAEPFGPANPLDIMVIAPATGNTIAKLAHGIWDTPVLMAAKSTLRNQRPVLLALFSNDALGMNGENIMRLYNTKNIFFVPFGQDDPLNKPTSMMADLGRLAVAVMCALDGKQLQPAIISHL